MSIAILLHLNAHGPIQRWRNEWDFDPLVPVCGTSYADALVFPVMEALEAVVPPDWPVQVSLQGEMGRTVFTHPRSWLTLLEQVKKRGKLRRALFGLSFNYQEIAGPESTRAEPDRAALIALWNACDFIGVSLYQKLDLPPRAENIASNLDLFIGAFAKLGCPLPNDKPLPIVEFGIGGGEQLPDGSFHAPARSAEAAARTPFAGTDDPAKNPWTNPALVKLRRETYAAFCDFLAQPPRRFSIPAAYTWSYGSLDVHGLTSPAFADKEIARRLLEHNRAARLVDP